MLAFDNIIQTLERKLRRQARCTEHDLIKFLKTENVAPFDAFELKNNRSLFSAHFLMRHCLYRLRDVGLEKKSFNLELTPVGVTLLSFHAGKDSKVSKHDPLRDYYLDLTHYFETSDEDIDALLNDFWTRYLSQEDRAQALSVLGLPRHASKEEVIDRYRLLAQKHHPDKGGNAETFVRISAAKKLLDNTF